MDIYKHQCLVPNPLSPQIQKICQQQNSNGEKHFPNSQDVRRTLTLGDYLKLFLYLTSFMLLSYDYMLAHGFLWVLYFILTLPCPCSFADWILVWEDKYLKKNAIFYFYWMFLNNYELQVIFNSKAWLNK